MLHELSSSAGYPVFGGVPCNSIPHLAAGLRGERFPSPFASPPGKGKSSSVVNVLWGTANLVAGCLLWAVYPFAFGLNLATLTFFLGFVLIGVQLSIHFETVRDTYGT
jgi:hypothetical protein